MFGGHFYNASIRRFVSVFGTLFNNLNVVRSTSGGEVKSITRVPLAYGPKQKFLARLDERPDLNAPDINIKLPRLSFEITGLAYDPSLKVSKLNKITSIDPNDSSKKQYVYTHTPYKINMQLAIMAKNQDDALQIIEQVIPYFQPEYTVSVKDIPDMGIISDVPIVLTGVTLSDDYEGDFQSRRAIVYTLDFEARIKFYGPIKNQSVIKSVTANMFDTDDTTALLEKYNATIDPIEAKEDETYTVTEEFVFAPQIDKMVIKYEQYDGTLLDVTTPVRFNNLENITGQTYGGEAVITGQDEDNYLITIENIEGYFRVGEIIRGGSTTTSWKIASITLI